MKEVITVELTASEVQEAVAMYLTEFGYKTHKVFVQAGIMKFDELPVKATVSKNEMPKKPIESVSVVRDEVWQFARAMEAQLRANEHKGGWNDFSYITLKAGIDKNYPTLLKELSKDDIDKHEITVRCVNVANYLMMIADNYGEGI